MVAGHHVEAGGVFAVAGAGAQEGEFAGDDGLEGEVDLGGDVADEDDGAAFACGGDGGLNRGVGADGFENEVSAAALGQLLDAGDGVGLVGADGFVGAEMICQPLGQLPGAVEGGPLGAQMRK